MTTAGRPRKQAPSPAPGPAAGPPPAPAEAVRHPYGPRPVGAVLPAVVRPAFRAQGAATAQLLADWPAIVGPGLAAVTVPRRLSAGTLVLGCAGPVALELQHLAGQLMERINTQLGRAAVERLRFVQEARPPVPASPRPRPPRAPVAVAGMADGPLREALGRLGAALGLGDA